MQILIKTTSLLQAKVRLICRVARAKAGVEPLKCKLTQPWFISLSLTNQTATVMFAQRTLPAAFQLARYE